MGIGEWADASEDKIFEVSLLFHNHQRRCITLE
jgi:hypothetical protein